MPAPADAPLRLPPLPADIIVEILFRVGDAVAVVRCAATCKAWRRLILEPSFVSRSRAGPSSLLGFFFRDTSQKRPRRRRYLGPPTRFLLLGPPQSVFHLSHFLPNEAALNGFNVVASDLGGLLALRRGQSNSCDPVTICVCHPMAGTSTFLPPLPPTELPGSVIFLDADASSFRLLAAMEMDMGHSATILLRVFSSRTRDWGTALTAQPPDNLVFLLDCPAVVHHGAVHWICHTSYHPYAVHALAVRLGQSEASVRRVDFPLQAGINLVSHDRDAVRLSSSSQGCLSLIFMETPMISIWNFHDDETGGKSWALHKMVYLMPDPFAHWSPSITALCDNGGSLFLSVPGEGLFMVNLQTEMTLKVCDGHCDKYMYPYMSDLSSCLGAMKSF